MNYFRPRQGSRLRTKTIVQPDANICIFRDIWRPGNVFSHFFVFFCISSPVRWPDSVKESHRHKDASSSPQLGMKSHPTRAANTSNSTQYFRPREGSRLRTKTIGQPDASRHYFRYREGIRLGKETIGKPDAKICIFLDIWRPGDAFSIFFCIFSIFSPILRPDSVKESHRHKDARFHCVL